MNRPKMSAPGLKQKVDEYINAAGKVDGEMPWDDPKVREDMTKLVSLRLSEPYYLKLVWLSEQTGKSQQRLLRDVLLPWIDEKIEEFSR